MSFTVSLPLFMERLKEAKDEAERFSDPLSRLPEATDGARYLYQKVLQPLMTGKNVSSAELDMSRFEQEDISAVYDVYEQQYSGYSNGLQKLHRIYTQCRRQPPACAPAAFL